MPNIVHVFHSFTLVLITDPYFLFISACLSLMIMIGEEDCLFVAAFLESATTGFDGNCDCKIPTRVLYVHSYCLIVSAMIYRINISKQICHSAFLTSSAETFS